MGARDGSVEGHRSVKKRCKDCGETKGLRCFYKHRSYRDGRMNSCKACKRQQVAENYELKVDVYRARKREISARPYYVAQRAAYNSSERGRQVHREVCRRYYRFKALELRA